MGRGRGWREEGGKGERGASPPKNLAREHLFVLLTSVTS